MKTRRRRLLGFLSVACVTAACGGGSLNGAAALSDAECSGALIKLDTAGDDDAALLLTAGHCVEGGRLIFAAERQGPEVLVDRPSVEVVVLYDDRGTPSEWRTDRIVYATMKQTDVAVLRLQASYRAIAEQARITPFRLARSGPAVGTNVRIPSGAFKVSMSCKVDAIVPTLVEHVWTWNDTIRLGTGCFGKPGMSGSPVIDDESDELVGLYTTAYEDGAACTFDNPCEVDASGQRRAIKGAAYGQQLAGLYPCLGEGYAFVAGGSCELPPD